MSTPATAPDAVTITLTTAEARWMFAGLREDASLIGLTRGQARLFDLLRERLEPPRQDAGAEEED